MNTHLLTLSLSLSSPPSSSFQCLSSDKSYVRKLTNTLKEVIRTGESE